MPTISASAFRRVLATNAKGVERTGQRIFHSTQRPWCSAPVPRHLVARKPSPGEAREAGIPYHLDIFVPCRKCDKCLAIRRLDWRSRIMSELRSCPKNWFVTLTFRPSSRKSFEDKGGALKPLAERTRIALQGVAEYLKRVRYFAGSLRFFVVTETHKDGYPHIHLLLHSYDGATQSQILSAKWPHGFVSAKLCDEHSAAYLVKYLTKEHSRVRASIKYGSPPTSGATGLSPSDEGVEKSDTVPLVGNEGYDLENKTARQGVSAQGMARGLVLQPEEIVRAMIYNREIDLNDGAAVLSTLFELGTKSQEIVEDVQPEQTGTPITGTVRNTARESGGAGRQKSATRDANSVPENSDPQPAKGRSSRRREDSGATVKPPRKTGGRSGAGKGKVR